jgi:flap endonuclease-1
VRNLTLSKTRTPEMLDLASALKAAGLTREQLVDAAILIGTDYNEGIHGVGPVKALALIKKHGDVHKALAAMGVKMPTAERVRKLYFEHPVDAKFTPRFGRPDEKRLKAFLEKRGIAVKREEDLLAAMGR